MRPKERIEPFMVELGAIWKENVPDWRFGQFIENIFIILRIRGIDPFLLEDDEFLEEIKKLF